MMLRSRFETIQYQGVCYCCSSCVGEPLQVNAKWNMSHSSGQQQDTSSCPYTLSNTDRGGGAGITETTAIG